MPETDDSGPLTHFFLAKEAGEQFRDAETHLCVEKGEEEVEKAEGREADL